MNGVIAAAFITLWNAAGSLAAVVTAESEGAARPVPRLAVLARASALRRQGDRAAAPGRRAGAPGTAEVGSRNERPSALRQQGTT